VPDGALAEATNCVIRYAGILEPRRGFSKHSAVSGFTTLSSFDGTLLGVVPNTRADYFNGSSWISMGGSVTDPPVNNPRNQFFSANKALYLTSGAGLQRTDAATNALQRAGFIRAKPFAVGGVATSTIGAAAWGILPGMDAVAYRLVYQRQVGTLFDIISPPSAPQTLVNTSGSTKSILLTVPLGPQVIVGDVVQIYRTVIATSGIPSDEFFLAISQPVTSAMLVAGFFTIFDTVPDAQLGVALYTNASQEGAGQENTPPPLSGDVCQFKGYTFYANTQRYQSMAMELRSANSGVGIIPGDTLTFDVGTTVALVAGTDFATNAFTTPWTVEYVLTTLADAINSNSTLKTHMQASVFLAENAIVLEAVTPNTAQWSLQFSAQSYTIATGGLSGGGSPGGTGVSILPPITGLYAPTGIVFDLAAVSTVDPNFPPGAYTNIDGGSDPTHISYINSVSTGTVTSIHAYTWTHSNPWLPWSVQGGLTTTPGLFDSSNSADGAGIAISKFQQAEAVPNDLTVGNPTFPIARILPLRQSVLVFKEGDGIWQITGDSPDDFTVVPYDQTVQIAQAWTAATLGDNVCLVSTKGPVGCNESGGVYPLAPSGHDCPIREEIAAALTFPTATAMDGIGYESEKMYILWTPDSATDSYNYNRVAWVYNLATAAWTTWPLAMQAGFVNALSDNKLYYMATAAWTTWPLTMQAGFVNALSDNKLYYTDGSVVYEERKDYADTDYQDVGGSLTIASVSGNTLHFSSAPPVTVGDYIAQGGATGWVLALAPTNNVILIGNSGTFTAGAATYARAITSTAVRLPWAGADKNPGVSHRFQEIAYNFRVFTAPFLTITTTTSLNPANPDSYVIRPTVNTASVGVNMRKGINPDNTQAILIQTGFVHAAALNTFNLQSTSLVDEPVSTRAAGG
jgi:hypothetical protein